MPFKNPILPKYIDHPKKYEALIRSYIENEEFQDAASVFIPGDETDGRVFSLRAYAKNEISDYSGATNDFIKAATALNPAYPDPVDIKDLANNSPEDLLRLIKGISDETLLSIMVNIASL